MTSELRSAAAFDDYWEWWLYHMIPNFVPDTDRNYLWDFHEDERMNSGLEWEPFFEGELEMQE